MESGKRLGNVYVNITFNKFAWLDFVNLPTFWDKNRSQYVI